MKEPGLVVAVDLCCVLEARTGANASLVNTFYDNIVQLYFFLGEMTHYRLCPRCRF